MTLPTNKLSEQQEWKFHPYTEIFDLMEGDDFKALVEDIKVKGQEVPVVMWNDQVLDGRNRVRACQQLGIAVKSIPYEGKDPLGFVWSANYLRRHLNETQRGIAAVKVANMRRGGSGANPSIEGIPKKSQAAAAKDFNVSVATVERASNLVKKGAPEVVKAAQKGQIKLGGLTKLLAKTKEEQQKLIAAKGSVVEAVKAAKAEPSKRSGSKSQAGKETEKPHVRYHAKQEEMIDLLRQFTAIEHAEEYVGKTKVRLDETLATMREKKAA
jgi:hypothetical protein